MQFTGNSFKCCVSFIDIVDSTRITILEITDEDKIKRFYSIFINTMAAIARSFGAIVIKNTGDSLVYYFPETAHLSYNVSPFRNVFECGLTMILANPIVNAKLLKENGSPNLSYRISADYGRVEVATSLTSATEDLFGPTLNLCAKINSKAEPNAMVIGSNLYQVTKTLCGDNYHFNKVGEYPIDDNFNNQYPVYSIVSKNKQSDDKNLKMLYQNILSN